MGLKDWLQTRDDMGHLRPAVCQCKSKQDAGACGKPIAWQDLKVDCFKICHMALGSTLLQELLEPDALEDRIKMEVDRFISLNQVSFTPKLRLVADHTYAWFFRNNGSFARVGRPCAG